MGVTTSSLRPVVIGLSERVHRGLEGLTPGYFALVMASGIISAGMKLGGFTAISWALLLISAVAFVTLVYLTAWRFVAYREAIGGDLNDPRSAFGFFTFVAGANVLGVRLGIEGYYGATAALLVISGISWLVLGYVVPWTAVLGRAERPIVATANGTWFNWAVASQSVAIAAAVIEPVYEPGRRELALLAVMSWSVGVFLYAAAGIFVSLRLMLYDFAPEELTPPYWVSMGALAITVLAGATIVEMADAPMVHATRELLAGLAVVCWACATWLIPVLVGAGWWRHVVRRVPLRYEAMLWSMIFPLGMYAVAGIYLGQADNLPLVGMVGSVELWVAFAGWAVVFVAMSRHVWQSVCVPAGARLSRPVGEDL